MKKTLKIAGIVLVVIFVPYGLWSINNFVYPFKSVHPNYTDVEQAFAKLQFPADWKEIDSSENRGLHGRGCDPLNNAGCFHKSKKFKVPDSLTSDQIKSFMVQSGCPGVLVSEFTYGGEEKRSFGFNCQLTDGSGVQLGISLRGPESTLNVTTKTY